ncbi:MAG: hypothetical protein P4L77_02520 [Sulfuriferula sp.]|nr:hypothetical protein [Sulfuriferula sp.]
MKKISLIVIAFAAMAAQASFADSTGTTPSMDSAQARAQTFQSLTPEQQQAAIDAAKQQGQATAQQKQANWNSMTPEQQQAQKETMQSNMQSKMAGMKSKMQSRMGGMSGGMGGGMMRSRMGQMGQ